MEEIPDAPKPIDGVPTSIAAFVGATKKGTINRAVRVASFGDFEREFGSHSADLLTSYSVAQFFANGGREAIVVRIARRASTAKTRAGIRALDAVDLFNLLILPGVSAPAILAAAADYCRSRRAFFIADPPEKSATPAEMLAFVRSSAFQRSPNAALYFPWTTVSDPLNSGHPRPLPPGGTIAGLIARTDAARGVWKSPAGPDASLIGVKSLAFLLSDNDSEPLNAAGVNCLRTFRKIFERHHSDPICCGRIGAVVCVTGLIGHDGITLVAKSDVASSLSFILISLNSIQLRIRSSSEPIKQYTITTVNRDFSAIPTIKVMQTWYSIHFDREFRILVALID